jgi:hypothetical protein
MHAANNTGLITLGQARLRVVFIHQRQIEIDVFLVFDHALHAMLNNHSHFMRKGRVVRHAIGDRRREDMAMAIFVLQALAVQCRTTCGAAQQETSSLHITRSPS